MSRWSGPAAFGVACLLQASLVEASRGDAQGALVFVFAGPVIAVVCGLVGLGLSFIGEPKSPWSARIAWLLATLLTIAIGPVVLFLTH